MKLLPAQQAPQVADGSEVPYDQLLDAAEGFQDQVEREGLAVERLKAEVAELKAEAHALSEESEATD